MVDFGFKDVSSNQKTKLVSEVFNRVAPVYDLMNDLMSFGIHRYWKQFALQLAMIRPNANLNILDLATGTGDLAVLMAKQMKGQGELILSDINENMLAHSKDRFIDEGFFKNISFVLADAEKLPFQANYFDRVTMAFGLRNVTQKAHALASILNVLKPGGFCLILEFSKPMLKWLEKIYNAYSFSIIPKLGKWIANDEASYRYLVESIRMHPDQNSLRDMMLNVGFASCEYFNLSAGIVSIHRGYKS
jgi:demethylmenaquinone methyltransferase/2-methoxy-6-polyprenyl-1,4-benzoquinol methylase